MSNVISVTVENIDYPLLRQQKTHLYDIIVENQKLTSDQLDALEGIVNLLDYITDKVEGRAEKVSPVNHQ